MSSQSAVIKILVVDDHLLVAEGIASLLGHRSGIKVVGIGSSGIEAIQQTTALKPDLVLLDIQMPQMSGIETARRLKIQDPDVKILMLTTFDDPISIAGALNAGASGYLLKSSSAEQIELAVRSVYQGCTFLGKGVRSQAIQARDPYDQGILPGEKAWNIPDATYLQLSGREHQILLYLVTDMSANQIAENLFLSTGTIRNITSEILKKLGLKNRTQLLVHARSIQQRLQVLKELDLDREW